MEISQSAVIRSPTEESIIEVDAVKLSGVRHLVKEAKGIVIIVPGSGSRASASANQTMAKHLHQEGLGTLVLDLIPEQERVFEMAEKNLPRLVKEPTYLTTLSNRLLACTAWLDEQHRLPIGYLGASTGASVALLAATNSALIKAVVSRGGRPDVCPLHLLDELNTPTLLLAGSVDDKVMKASQEAFNRMQAQHKTVEFKVIEGATHGFTKENHLKQAMKAAANHFNHYFEGPLR